MLKHVPFYGELLQQKINDKTPSQSHILMYGAIEVHAMGELGRIASNKTLGENIGLSASRAANIVSELSLAGWIKVDMKDNNTRTLITPLMTLAKSGKAPYQTSETPLTISGNISNNNKTQLETSAKANEDLFFKLVDNLRFERGRIKYSPARQSKLAARLKSFSADDLYAASQALAASPWHMGKNPTNTRYGTIDFLLRNDEMVERWINTGLPGTVSSGVAKV